MRLSSNNYDKRDLIKTCNMNAPLTEKVVLRVHEI